ncbi:lytic transglycosylase domain-containing protein [Pectinatus frisingensis]|uniref:lytic transglycosylase domain-containing protein n=1 Tax=Pectinatus frisingensis TaxID=865 RepID=UPI0018C617AC|nr:transglycosylase SLT domain-containing protein [Pectinatus frisingensis]
MSVISELMVKIGADSSGLSKELDKSQAEIKQAFNVNPVNEMQNALTGTTSSISALITKFAGLAAVAAGGFGLSSIIQSAVDAGENVYQLSNRLHITNAEAVEMSRVLNLTGADVQTAASAFLRFDKNLTSNSTEGKKAQATLKAVGVSMQDSNGKLLPLNEQLKNLAQGYKLASDAGYGQEFIMNTLGVRGMSLTKTLQNYTEAAENAAKVKGIGLDVEQMHKISQQLDVLKMQAGQLELVGGAVFAPIAAELFPPIIAGLAETAKYVAVNKTEIIDLSKDLLELVAIYKTFQAVSSISSKVSNVWAQTKPVAAVADTTGDALITANQQKSINKRTRLLEQAAEKEKKTMQQTVMAMQISEEEKAALVAKNCIEIEQRTAVMAEKITADMTAAYQAMNTENAASAEKQTAGFASVQIAAAKSANLVISANERVAESEAVKADSAKIASAAAVEANTAIAESAEAARIVEVELGESIDLVGIQAIAAGEKAVTAQTESIVATQAASIEQEALGAKTALAGEAAVAAGTKTVVATGSAATAVTRLTSLVWALAGGWLGVAAAIGYAIYKMYEWKQQKDTENRNNTYDLNGKQYFWNKDTNSWTTQEDDSNAGYTVYDPKTGGYTANAQKTVEVTDEDTVSQLDQAAGERWLDTDQGKAWAAQQEAEKKQADIDAQQQALASQFADINNIGDKTPKEKKLKAPEVLHYSLLETDQLKPYANEIEYAANTYGIDPNFLASIIMTESNGDSNAVSSAGAIGLGQLMPDTAAELGVNPYDANENIMGSAQYAASLYHSFGDYRLAAAGYNAGGGAVEKYGDVPPYEETQNYVAKVMGLYNSSSTYFADGTEKNNQQNIQKKLEDLKKAQQEATSLMTSMQEGIYSETATTYQQGMNKVVADVAQKNGEIAKLQAAGVNVDGLKTELGEYETVMKTKVVNAWKKSWSEVKEDTKSTLAAVNDDYAAAADVEYQTTLRKLADERKEKLKAIAEDQNDAIAKVAVEEWANVQLLAAQKKYDEAIKQSHEKRMQALEDEGDYRKIIEELTNNPQAEKNDLDMDGQKALAKEYVTLWDDAHSSIYNNLASSASSFYSSMSSSMSDFITGTHSAINVVHDFEKSVLNAIANIVAQKAAAQVTGSLLSAAASLFGSSLDYKDASKWSMGGTSLGAFKISMPAFANGGIVSAPTLALVGERPGVKEAIIPLPSNGLIGGGGDIQVNIVNNTSSNVQMQNSSYDDSLQKTVLNFVVDGVQRNVNNSASSLKTLLSSR